jgi:putative flippase GtrA
VWLTRLYARFQHLVHELGKFGTVGAVAYVVDTALFAVLLLAMESLTAKTIATVIAASVAFVGNRFWTWRHRARSGLAREYLLYFSFNGVGLAISLAMLGISHYLLGAVWPVFQTPLADLISANVVGLAAGTSFRFWSYRRFVFRELASGSDAPGRELASGEQLSSGLVPELAGGDDQPGNGSGPALDPHPASRAPATAPAVAPVRRGGVA